jgi:phosphonate transport system permease protein
MTKVQNTQAEQKPSLVPPVVASLVSIILPGFGHVLARIWQRGILIFASFFTILGLAVWRVNQDVLKVGQKVTRLGDVIDKIWRLQPILLVTCVAAFILYLLIIFDAYQVAARKTKGATRVLLVLLISFFLLGWEIGKIDLPLFARELGKSKYRVSQIFWPWEEAISRAESEVMATQDIQVPCTDNPPSPNPVTDEPWISATPTCGNLSQQDGTPGTTLSVEAGNFSPNTETEILWVDPLVNEFRARQAGEYLSIVTDDQGTLQFDIVMPYRLVPSSAVGPQIWKIKARQLSATGEIGPSEILMLAMSKMIETIFLGMMATFFGIIFALPVSFFAAKNLMSGSWITLLIYYIVRTILNIVRSVEPLIWAVIAVAIVGLGPFAGIISLTLHSVAALGKLYSEAIESIDHGPIEAVHATGANWLQTVVYAVVPQIIPPFVSFTIYRWDINVRMSTIIGLVGGGGIGYLLIQWIRLLDFKAAGIAVWFIILTVATLDNVSAEIRQRFV